MNLCDLFAISCFRDSLVFCNSKYIVNYINGVTNNIHQVPMVIEILFPLNNHCQNFNYLHSNQPYHWKGKTWDSKTLWALSVKLSEERNCKEDQIEDKLFVEVRLCLAVKLIIYHWLDDNAIFNVFRELLRVSSNHLRKLEFS